MKNIQTPSHMFMAVKLETTGNFDRNLINYGIYVKIYKMFQNQLI